MDFVAIDFETANSNRASACAVGLVRVSDGRVVDSYSSFIKPNEDHNWENFWNFNVHGIPFGAYQDSPTFLDIWPEIQAFLGEFPVFAHNATFDSSVMRNTMLSWQMPPLAFDFRCSMRMAQKILKTQADVSLPSLADRFGILSLNHHDALSDAETCAEIVFELLRIEPTFDFSQLSSNSPRQRIHQVLKSDKEYLERAKLFLESPDNGIAGKVFTLTGKLELGTRSQVMGIIEGLGGGFVKDTSKKTEVLVQGIENPSSFAPGHDHSESYETAQALRAAGIDIEILYEDQFAELIPGEFFDSKN